MRNCIANVTEPFEVQNFQTQSSKLQLNVIKPLMM